MGTAREATGFTLTGGLHRLRSIGLAAFSPSRSVGRRSDDLPARRAYLDIEVEVRI
jgi:hypothetical protein